MACSCSRLSCLPIFVPFLPKFFSSPPPLLPFPLRISPTTRFPHFGLLPSLPSPSPPLTLCLATAPQKVTLEPPQARSLSPAASPIAHNVIDILQERGLVESLTHDDIRAACAQPATEPVKVYCGFDPTAESLHLGNLLGLIVLSWFQRCGHSPVALLGGATARVGDPSGKSVERPTLDEATIDKNLEGVRSNIERILKVGEVAAESMDTSEEGIFSLRIRPRPALILNNYDWWKHFSLLEFLRDVGKFARVGTMTAKESVKKRLTSEEGMSFTEFSYQLLQGYDFVHLFRKEGVSIQIGGSDQWGNITAGTELIRKILHRDGAYGLTFPLLLKNDGSKFGKSESGAIWLSPSMLSAYKFYQHLFATPDADVISFLKKLTFLSLDEIQELEAAMEKAGYVPNSAQVKLAEEVTRFVHGEEGLREALRATEALAPGGTTRLDWKAIQAIASDLPSFSISHPSVMGSTLVDLCVTVGFLPSKGAVRRLIKQGGLYLNNEKIEDEGKIVEAEDIVENRMLLLSAGKKNKLVVRLQ